MLNLTFLVLRKLTSAAKEMKVPFILSRLHGLLS